jgi:type IV pilus assembly protein PilX
MRPRSARGAAGTKPYAQQGAALIVGLIMLTLLGMLGLLSMKRALLEELMSGTRADQQIALQAAESALRDAESYVYETLDSASEFDAACTGGLCLPGTEAPAWRTVDWDNDSIEYGTQTGAASLPGLTRQPCYVIELLPRMAPQNGNSLSTVRGAGAGAGTPFRITAVGYGRLSGTRVMLQSTFVKQ